MDRLQTVGAWIVVACFLAIVVAATVKTIQWMF